MSRSIVVACCLSILSSVAGAQSFDPENVRQVTDGMVDDAIEYVAGPQVVTTPVTTRRVTTRARRTTARNTTRASLTAARFTPTGAVAAPAPTGAAAGVPPPPPVTPVAPAPAVRDVRTEEPAARPHRQRQREAAAPQTHEVIETTESEVVLPVPRDTQVRNTARLFRDRLSVKANVETNRTRIQSRMEAARAYQESARRALENGKLFEAEQQARLGLKAYGEAKYIKSNVDDAMRVSVQQLRDGQERAVLSGRVTASERSILTAATEEVAEDSNSKQNELAKELHDLWKDLDTLYTRVQQDKTRDDANIGVLAYRGEAVGAVLYEFKLSQMLKPISTNAAASSAAEGAASAPVTVTTEAQHGASRFALQIGASISEELTPGSATGKNIVGFLGGSYRLGDLISISAGGASNSGEFDPYIGIVASLGRFLKF